VKCTESNDSDAISVHLRLCCKLSLEVIVEKSTVTVLTNREVNIYDAVIPLCREKNDDVNSNYTFSPRVFAIRRCPWACFICEKNFHHRNSVHGHEKYFPVFMLLTGISCHWLMAKNVVFDYNDNRNFVRLEVMAYAEP
jgi:hypothetical protein